MPSPAFANLPESEVSENKRSLSWESKSQLQAFLKAVAALHNRRGGRIVVGVSDDNLAVSRGAQYPPGWRALVDADQVSRVLNKYLSAPLSVEARIDFELVPNTPLVVYDVPSHDGTPIFTAPQVGDLWPLSDNCPAERPGDYIQPNTIYFRSSASGQWSSSRLMPSNIAEFLEYMRQPEARREERMRRLIREELKSHIEQIARLIRPIAGAEE